MGKIVISENIALDGGIRVSADGEDGRFGAWFGWMEPADREAWAKVEFEEALGADALLMGRVSYSWFLARGWQTRTGAWADRLRSLPKYVVSQTLDDLGWDNTTVLTGDVPAEVAKLRERVSGDIVVYGSGRLAKTLVEHDLVDELRLMVYPFVLGGGDRLFGETSDMKPLRLVDVRAVGAGIAFLTYRPA